MNGTVTSGGSFDQVTMTQTNGTPHGTFTFSVDNGADGQGFFAGNYDVKGAFVIVEDVQNNLTQEAKIISLDKDKMVLELDLSQATKLYTLGVQLVSNSFKVCSDGNINCRTSEKKVSIL